MSKRVGVKLYYDRETRDSTVYWQRIGYHNKIAPPVGELVYISGKEIVKTMDHDLKKARTWWYSRWDNSGLAKNIYGYLTHHVTIDNWYRANNDSMRKLHDIMERLGMNYNDAIGHNLGWYKKRLICIDFDPESILRGDTS